MNQRQRKRQLAHRARVTYFVDPVQHAAFQEREDRRWIITMPRRHGVTYVNKWLKDLEKHAALLRQRSHSRRPLRRAFPVPANAIMPQPMLTASNCYGNLGMAWSLPSLTEAT